MISINIKDTRINLIISGLLLFIMISLSCSKEPIIQDDPYKGGMQPLGVKFTGDEPTPNAGSPGDEVTFKISGLENYDNKFEFLINETKTDILSFTDSTITVKVPQNASTGGTTLLLNGQSFFGPKFTIQGKVSIDPSFKAVNGTNGAISDITSTSSGYILVGAFTNFESQAPAIPVNRIVSISNDGVFQTSLSSRLGADGSIQSINKLSSGKYMVSGSFGSYNRISGINCITRLNVDGSLDSTQVEVINSDPERPNFGFDTVAAFNGGVVGRPPFSIVKSFVKDNKTIILGNFLFYLSYYYPRSTRENKIVDVTRMAQLARLKENGELDSTYNFDPSTKGGYAGGNGPINDAFMQEDGKVVAVGAFSTFHGLQANNIVRLNDDGTVDKTYATGSGADGPITSVNYNSTTGRVLVAGNFKTFNGRSCSGVAMLNKDGSVDDVFKFGQLVGGVPNYAAQLNNGKVLVSGDFNTYAGIIRQGFMILDQNGSLAQGYNNTGAFQGRIVKMVQTTSALGYPAVLLVGDFTKFDNRKVGNIVRVEIKP
ncbi:MAG TPA: DUF5008 domain-containing protein [Pedobacter sp.]|uniref:DUF5008 domain-containing protein n=1 Tax=Pedobacter sp. TaxID=1411316 RepID=UPI002BC1E752|nr:DUF5008 domain-containing protein [Pedobacter sp.]HMI04426.1 DUF5008 domain-containing protein [Pedobacter sp.]